jgi:hypothetical protein
MEDVPRWRKIKNEPRCYKCQKCNMWLSMFEIMMPRVDGVDCVCPDCYLKYFPALAAKYRIDDQIHAEEMWGPASLFIIYTTDLQARFQNRKIRVRKEKI